MRQPASDKGRARIIKDGDAGSIMAQIYSWQGELSGPFQSLLGLFALEGAEALGNYIDDILSQMSPAARNRLYRQIMKAVQDARRDLAEKKALSGPDAKFRDSQTPFI